MHYPAIKQSPELHMMIITQRSKTAGWVHLGFFSEAGFRMCEDLIIIIQCLSVQRGHHHLKSLSLVIVIITISVKMSEYWVHMFRKNALAESQSQFSLPTPSSILADFTNSLSNENPQKNSAICANPKRKQFLLYIKPDLFATILIKKEVNWKRCEKKTAGISPLYLSASLPPPSSS